MAPQHRFRHPAANLNQSGVTMTRRAFYWPILLVGVLLIVAPFAISLPSKASAGQSMLDNFHPIMQPASVKETVDLYNNTFVALKPVALGGIAASSETPQLLAGLAAALHMTQPQVEKFLGQRYPAFAQLLGSFPQLVPVFQRVGPGLAHYAPLVSTMEANVQNYQQVDSLPSFRLFTWFFVVPGALIAILALLGLGVFARRRPATPSSDATTP
jgi:hypothetical protein